MTIPRLAAMATMAALLAIGPAPAQAAAPRPADIDPRSMSRLPPVDPAQMDEETKRVLDFVTNGGKTRLAAPSQMTLYSPKITQSLNELNRALRAQVNGIRTFELAVLVAAREFDGQYIWHQHEPAAREAGLEQPVIDAVKFNRDVAGLAEKDATLVRLGRAMIREHRVAPELWARMVALYGRRGAVEATATISDYSMACLMLSAVDQQIPGEAGPPLPVNRSIH